MRRILTLLLLLLWSSSLIVSSTNANQSGEVLIINITGPINPATDDYLKDSIAQATQRDAKLLVIKLNTPGGLLTSMQTIVEQMLDSPVPIAVYVTPSGGGAISAGVFITLAGNFAAMAPGTTIGAAHPVTGAGQDIGDDMRQKVENFAVSLIKAISEQRGRNVEWAEKAVRESVAITDREALEAKIIDFIASDLERLLTEIEGKTTTVRGNPITLVNVVNAPKTELEMNFKQKVINILADPNVAILLGLGAMLGIGIELYNPGGMLPGIVGVICLVLSLTSAQVLPINYGGLALIALSAIFFAVEFFMPAFGLWGIAGIICLVLGSIYLIDTDQVWSVEGLAVDTFLIGGIALGVGLILLTVSFLVLRVARKQVSTGREGLVGKPAITLDDFTEDSTQSFYVGRVRLMGEIWRARTKNLTFQPKKGQDLIVQALEERLTVIVDLG